MEFAIILKAQSLKSFQVPKDKLSKVSKLKEISKDGYSKGNTPLDKALLTLFNFHWPSGPLIVLAEVGYYLDLICIMHYLYPGSLADIFTYILLSGRPLGATSSRWAPPSPSSFLLFRVAILAELRKYKLQVTMVRVWYFQFVSSSADATEVSKNRETHAFIPPCDVTGSGNLEGS